MCGFAGEFVFGAPAGRAADVTAAKAMAREIAHRGPDEQGAFLSTDGRCAIGFHRLAVIDPPGSHQPMTAADQSATVAFNGEIYNFRELRKALAEEGAIFATDGDTEVLLHLYRHRGLDMLDALRGMFAFVLYDAAAGRLLLARDRLGQKPLWYAMLADRIVFASESRALLRHPRVDGSLDRPSLAVYMVTGYIPCPHTAWRGVRKLPPGCRMVVANAPAAPQRYWRLGTVPVPHSPRECIERVRAQLAASVEARMNADVPLGALLSGGLDSGVVVGLMCRVAGSGGGVRTFTAGFEDGPYDERPAARATARRLGTEHKEIVVPPAPAEAVDELVRMYGEPFADSSALPTWLLCRAAREHITVALTGDGGDEVFGGYDRYRAVHLAETMRPAAYLAVRLAAGLIRPFTPTGERSRLRRLVRFADSLPHPPGMQYLMLRSVFEPQDLPRLFTREFAAEVDLETAGQWFLDLYEEGEFSREVQYAQRHDLLSYLPDDLLVKADIASMAASLELRCPMLDHELVALGLSLPVEMKIAHGRGKAILREAFGDLLPREVLRAPKRGFGVPLGRWLREGLAETLRETLTDRSFLDRGIVRAEAVAGLLNDHLSGRDDHRHRLWALLILARWLRQQG
jgi:asparagine synthase (glutamine-hydrolysing)